MSEEGRIIYHQAVEKYMSRLAPDVRSELERWLLEHTADQQAPFEISPAKRIADNAILIRVRSRQKSFSICSLRVNREVLVFHASHEKKVSGDHVYVAQNQLHDLFTLTTSGKTRN